MSFVEKEKDSELKIFPLVSEFYAAAGLKEQFSHSNIGLRINLFSEEFSETLAAMKKHDLVEFFDGIADMTYILAGTSLEFKSVMAGDDSPENTHLKAILASIMEIQSDAISSFDGAILELLKDEDCYFEFLNKILAEVHRSNMSKFFKSDSDYLELAPGVPFLIRENNGWSHFVRPGDFKVIKPKNWTGPNLHPILAEYLK